MDTTNDALVTVVSVIEQDTTKPIDNDLKDIVSMSISQEQEAPPPQSLGTNINTTGDTLVTTKEVPMISADIPVKDIASADPLPVSIIPSPVSNVVDPLTSEIANALIPALVPETLKNTAGDSEVLMAAQIQLPLSPVDNAIIPIPDTLKLADLAPVPEILPLKPQLPELTIASEVKSEHVPVVLDEDPPKEALPALLMPEPKTNQVLPEPLIASSLPPTEPTPLSVSSVPVNEKIEEIKPMPIPETPRPIDISQTNQIIVVADETSLRISVKVPFAKEVIIMDEKFEPNQNLVLEGTFTYEEETDSSRRMSSIPRRSKIVRSSMNERHREAAFPKLIEYQSFIPISPSRIETVQKIRKLIEMPLPPTPAKLTEAPTRTVKLLVPESKYERKVDLPASPPSLMLTNKGLFSQVESNGAKVKIWYREDTRGAEGPSFPSLQCRPVSRATLRSFHKEKPVVRPQPEILLSPYSHPIPQTRKPAVSIPKEANKRYKLLEAVRIRREMESLSLGFLPLLSETQHRLVKTADVLSLFHQLEHHVPKDILASFKPSTAIEPLTHLSPPSLPLLHGDNSIPIDTIHLNSNTHPRLLTTRHIKTSHHRRSPPIKLGTGKSVLTLNL